MYGINRFSKSFDSVRHTGLEFEMGREVRPLKRPLKIKVTVPRADCLVCIPPEPSVSKTGTLA
uniref:Uncharacterized protein n=1 Tax=Rhodnius prolixus TaxID=13249 RepID=T1IFF2_RHOPR